jgi:hypothetical protein
MLISRGIKRERRDSDGTLVSQATDEVTLRGIWSEWKKVMSQDAPASALEPRRARTGTAPRALRGRG